MKKTGQIFVVAALVFVAAFAGCRKEESEEMIDVITSKTWKFGLTDLNKQTNPSGNNAYYAVLECEQDDTFTFKTDGTVLRAYGAKKCTGNDAANQTFSYSYNKATKELVMDGVKYTVVEENKTQFKYVQTMPNVSGVSNQIYLLQ